MSIHVLNVPPSPHADFLHHPLKALSITLDSWMQRRRRAADRALLMSLAPHMLNDIGVAREDEHGSVLRWHPAVLATNLRQGGRAAEADY